MEPQAPKINFENSFAHQMGEFYKEFVPSPAQNPEIVIFNQELSDELDLRDLEESAEKWLSASPLPYGAEPLAQAYSGHQFGQFNPHLGDGRAVLIGEVIDKNGARRDLQLKGAGRTPYGLRGDGKLILGPALREYIMGEAMHALGIPTTRGLAVVKTGETVMRDRARPGAILTRVASSHLRVGTFQYAAMQNDRAMLQKLADYAIWRHYPDLASRDDRYAAFLSAVIESQAHLIAEWQSIGFIHGVMNTDNMAISGETIDYGPCAFMEAYDPATVFSSIDHSGRYAFGRQPAMGQWNLARLAESLLPLLSDNEDDALQIATKAVDQFADEFLENWSCLMGRKIGLENPSVELINSLLTTMKNASADYTLTFRALANWQRGEKSQIYELFGDSKEILEWIAQWQLALGDENPSKSMDQVNPIYIPRNEIMEQVLHAAESGDNQPLADFLIPLRAPFKEHPEFELYARSASKDFGPYVTYCGT